MLRIHLMGAQAAFLALSFHLSLRFSFHLSLHFRSLSTFAALCFVPATLQRDSKCATNRWGVLTEERRLVLGQPDREYLDHDTAKQEFKQCQSKAGRQTESFISHTPGLSSHHHWLALTGRWGSGCGGTVLAVQPLILARVIQRET